MTLRCLSNRLTKNARSARASILGDPDFPKIATDFTRGSKVLVIQDLYKYYSRLKFSYTTDRPIAIAGLEKRLIQSFGLKGGYGVVDDDRPGLLRRSLLWCRGSDEESLKRIFSPPTERVFTDLQAHPPSWSWMAHEGGIDYLELPFDGVEWDERAIDSPWSGASIGTWDSSGDSGQGCTLRAIVRTIDSRARKQTDFQVIYDSPEKSFELGMGLKCVTLGRLKSGSRAQAHCALLVVPMGSDLDHEGKPRYERVGVGYVPRDWIGLEEPELASIY